MADKGRLPLAAGALLVEGVIHTHTSVRGDLAPELHPLVRRHLNKLPTSQRERFVGWCAEAVLLSDRLYEAERAGGGVPLSPVRARAVLWGAKIRITRVREPGDPSHGQAQRPCRSCESLLDWFGVEVLS